MGISKAAQNVLVTVLKGDGSTSVARFPDAMADQEQCIASCFRAFRLDAGQPLLCGELTERERRIYDNYYKVWEQAVQRNTICLKMPSKQELTQFIRERRGQEYKGPGHYLFEEGIAFNPYYLRDLHTVLGKVETLMWDGHPYHPVTARTTRGSAILLPCNTNG